MSEDNDSDDEGVPASDPAGGDDDDGGGEGAPAWMATFADLVTLLMCFFVLLFAMSTTQQETFKELIQSLRSALGVQQIPEAGTREGLVMSMDPEEETEPKPEAVDEVGGMVQKQVDEIVSDVQELIMFNKLGGMVQVKANELGAIITISDVVLFPVGVAKMSPEGKVIMAKISKVLKQFSYHIKIAGHTDNTPINTAQFASNWELSVNRATEVVRYLISQGLNPKNISAEGYAEFQPITSNDTAQGRSKNRRVEIVYERKSIEKKLVSASP